MQDIKRISSEMNEASKVSTSKPVSAIHSNKWIVIFIWSYLPPSHILGDDNSKCFSPQKKEKKHTNIYTYRLLR